MGPFHKRIWVYLIILFSKLKIRTQYRIMHKTTAQELQILEF